MKVTKGDLIFIGVSLMITAIVAIAFPTIGWRGGMFSAGLGIVFWNLLDIFLKK